MFQAVGPESVTGQTYIDLDANTQIRLQHVIRKWTWFVAAILLPGDGKGLNSAFINVRMRRQ